MPDLTLSQDAEYLANALTLGCLADAAYGDHPEKTASFRRTTFSDAGFFESKRTDTQGFVTSDDKNVVLSFRGTEDVRDWITNLSFGMRSDLGGKVHYGFASALDSVWDRIQKLLDQNGAEDKTVWVTGHSLGGALATLAAKRLPGKFKPFSVATFGQPRVGDAAFARGYKVKHDRFVNNKDIVPTVPPRFIPGAWPPAFYQHIGKLRFFDKKGDLVDADKSKEELGVFPDLLDALGALSNQEADAKDLLIQGISDHKMAKYLACLERNQS